MQNQGFKISSLLNLKSLLYHTDYISILASASLTESTRCHYVWEHKNEKDNGIFWERDRCVCVCVYYVYVLWAIACNSHSLYMLWRCSSAFLMIISTVGISPWVKMLGIKEYRYNVVITCKKPYLMSCSKTGENLGWIWVSVNIILQGGIN